MIRSRERPTPVLVVTPLQRSFRVNQNVGDVLEVADFVHVAPHFDQRIVAR